VGRWPRSGLGRLRRRTPGRGRDLRVDLHATDPGAQNRKNSPSIARLWLLIVDDFGLKPLRPPADEVSNLDFTEWGPGVPGQQSVGRRDARSHAPQRVLPGARRPQLSVATTTATTDPPASCQRDQNRSSLKPSMVPSTLVAAGFHMPETVAPLRPEGDSVLRFARPAQRHAARCFWPGDPSIPQSLGVLAVRTDRRALPSADAGET
jgi:hypothetical protein